MAVALVFLGFSVLWILEIQFNVPSNKIVGVSLLGYMAWAKALSTLTKYLYQIHKNFIDQSTQGLSFSAYFNDFMGSCFALTQLEIDSYLRGYAFFLFDPRLNFALCMLSVFSFVNTLIVLG